MSPHSTKKKKKHEHLQPSITIVCGCSRAESTLALAVEREAPGVQIEMATRALLMSALSQWRLHFTHLEASPGIIDKGPHGAHTLNP